MVRSDELSELCAAQARRGRHLRAQLAALAAGIAATEDDVADVLTRMAEDADPPRAESLRAKAHAAQRFAEYERRQAHHWAALPARRS